MALERCKAPEVEEFELNWKTDWFGKDYKCDCKQLCALCFELCILDIEINKEK